MVKSPYFIILHDDFPAFPHVSPVVHDSKVKNPYVSTMFQDHFPYISPVFFHLLTVNSPSHPRDLRGEGAAHESSAPDDGADEDQLRPWQAIRQKTAG